MAHEYVLKMLENINPMQLEKPTRDGLAYEAFQLVDAMQAEADKRAKQKRAELREILNHPNTFVEKEGQHFDDVHFEVDWDRLPNNANYWAMDADGACNAYQYEPEMCGDHWDFGDVICGCYHFDYTGDWRNSLRKRPEVEAERNG